jgi:hypothetical protein
MIREYSESNAAAAGTNYLLRVVTKFGAPSSADFGPNVCGQILDC